MFSHFVFLIVKHTNTGTETCYKCCNKTEFIELKKLKMSQWYHVVSVFLSGTQKILFLNIYIYYI